MGPDRRQLLTFQDINYLGLSVSGMRNDNALSKCSQMNSSLNEKGDELSTLNTETMSPEDWGARGPTRFFNALIHLSQVSLAA